MAVVSVGYVTEGKRFATLAIGCTGGRHRSSAMAEELARRLVPRACRRPSSTAIWVESELPRFGTYFPSGSLGPTLQRSLPSAVGTDLPRH